MTNKLLVKNLPNLPYSNPLFQIANVCQITLDTTKKYIVSSTLDASKPNDRETSSHRESIKSKTSFEDVFYLHVSINIVVSNDCKICSEGSLRIIQIVNSLSLFI